MCSGLILCRQCFAVTVFNKRILTWIYSVAAIRFTKHGLRQTMSNGRAILTSRYGFDRVLKGKIPSFLFVIELRCSQFHQFIVVRFM